MNLFDAMRAVELDERKQDKIENLKNNLFLLDAQKFGHEKAIELHQEEIKRINKNMNLLTMEIIETLEGMLDERHLGYG